MIWNEQLFEKYQKVTFSHANFKSKQAPYKIKILKKEKIGPLFFWISKLFGGIVCIYLKVAILDHPNVHSWFLTPLFPFTTCLRYASNASAYFTIVDSFINIKSIIIIYVI